MESCPPGGCEPQEEALLLLWPRSGQRSGRRFRAGKDPGHSFTSVFLGWPLAYLSQGKAGEGEEEILRQRSDSARGDKGPRPRHWLREGGTSQAVTSLTPCPTPLHPPGQLGAAPAFHQACPPGGRRREKRPPGLVFEGWWWPLGTGSGDWWGQRPGYRGKGGWPTRPSVSPESLSQETPLSKSGQFAWECAGFKSKSPLSWEPSQAQGNPGSWPPWEQRSESGVQGR